MATGRSWHRGLSTCPRLSLGSGVSHRSGWTQRGGVGRHTVTVLGFIAHSSPFISWVMVFMCTFAQTTCLVSFVPVTKQALVPP